MRIHVAAGSLVWLSWFRLISFFTLWRAGFSPSAVLGISKKLHVRAKCRLRALSSTASSPFQYSVSRRSCSAVVVPLETAWREPRDCSNQRNQSGLGNQFFASEFRLFLSESCHCLLEHHLLDFAVWHSPHAICVVGFCAVRRTLKSPAGRPSARWWFKKKQHRRQFGTGRHIPSTLWAPSSVEGDFYHGLNQTATMSHELAVSAGWQPGFSRRHDPDHRLPGSCADLLRVSGEPKRGPHEGAPLWMGSWHFTCVSPKSRTNPCGPETCAH